MNQPDSPQQNARVGRSASPPYVTRGVNVHYTVQCELGYFAHRHPEFWDDPEVFDPGRFRPERASRMHPFAYYPFGGGPRSCRGRNLAPIICQLIVVMLVQRFSLTFEPRLPGDPVLVFDFELAPRGGMWMQARNTEEQKPPVPITESISTSMDE